MYDPQKYCSWYGLSASAHTYEGEVLYFVAVGNWDKIENFRIFNSTGFKKIHTKFNHYANILISLEEWFLCKEGETSLRLHRTLRIIIGMTVRRMYAKFHRYMIFLRWNAKSTLWECVSQIGSEKLLSHHAELFEFSFAWHSVIRMKNCISLYIFFVICFIFR